MFEALSAEDLAKLQSLSNADLLSMLAIEDKLESDHPKAELSARYRNLLREFDEGLKELCGSDGPFRATPPTTSADPAKSRVVSASAVAPPMVPTSTSPPTVTTHAQPSDRLDPSKAAMEAAKALRKRKLEADEARARKVATVSGQHFTAAGYLLRLPYSVPSISPLNHIDVIWSVISEARQFLPIMDLGAMETKLKSLSWVPSQFDPSAPLR